MIGRDFERGVVDARFEIGDVFEDEGGSEMIAEGGRGGGVFDDGAIGGEVSTQNAQAAFGLQRIVERADDIGITYLGVCHILRQSAAGDSEGVAVQQGKQLLEHRRDAAGVEEVFHLILPGGAHVGDERAAAAQLIESRQGQVKAGAASDGGQVDDGVGAAAEGVEQGDGVVKGFGCQDLGGAEVLLDQLDDLSSGGGRQAQAARIGGRDRPIARQRHAQRFHQRVHGRGRAHDHAMPVRCAPDSARPPGRSRR